jgi:hypothetical protein
MRKLIMGVALCIAAFAMNLVAQVTGSGTSGTVPVFTGASTVGNSPISVSGSNVGIGTPSPAQTLDANGNYAGIFGTSGNQSAIRVGLEGFPESTFGALYLGIEGGGSVNIGSTRPDALGAINLYTMYSGTFAPRMTVANNGYVGIGTPSPVTTVHVVSGGNVAGAGGSIGISANSNRAPMFTIQGSLVNSGISGDTGNVLFNVRPSGTSALVPSMTLLNNGSVGIGTTAPGAALEVNGSVKLTASSGASITFQDGTTQSTAYTGVTCGGDYAESVDVMGDRKKYEPGDVLVIDPDAPGKFLKSAEPYSTSVTGIYSTKPGTVGRRQATPKSSDEVPMAMVGIVPAKVSAENGSIRPGDLLVTASTFGYAMKGTDRSRMLGAVIGKALGNLDSGTGVIEVVVTLQ